MAKQKEKADKVKITENNKSLTDSLANYVDEEGSKDNENCSNTEIVRINISDKPLPKMLSISDIELHLGISQSMVYKLVKTDGFPTIKIGKRILIPEDDYEKWLNKVKGTEIIVK